MFYVIKTDGYGFIQINNLCSGSKKIYIGSWKKNMHFPWIKGILDTLITRDTLSNNNGQLKHEFSWENKSSYLPLAQYINVYHPVDFTFDAFLFVYIFQGS